MSETLNQIPPEAWPLIDLLFNLTMASAGIWLGITVFVLWRRASSNLTPVNAAEKSRKAQPDFLKVDKKARAEALERGDAFDKELERREREEEKAKARGGRRPATVGQRLARFLSFFMSLFTLATMIFGAIFQVSRMGQMMQEYSTLERIIAVIQNHPVSFTIATLVIVFQVYRFFSERNWQEG
ncbi:MAG: hypothetical protein R3265_16115 [Hyphomonas sp.]|nr:hypothetical protein [Hyphomonas sp.]